MSAFKMPLAGAAIVFGMAFSTPVMADQQQATVILSQSCEYMLLNSSRGMVLLQ